MARRTAEDAEETKRSLIQAARQLFAEKSFDSVALEGLSSAAGVTRGALYHHFDGKLGLFRAVLEQIVDELGQKIMETTEDSQDPWDGLRKGCHVFIEGTQNPEYRQIVMIDAPAVLGVDEWQKLDYRGTTSVLEEGLGELIPYSQKISVEALAHALSGALNQISLRAGTVEAGEQELSVSTAKKTIDFLLSSISTAIDR